MDFIELLKVIFLGIVEGITEWLPIRYLIPSRNIRETNGKELFAVIHEADFLTFFFRKFRIYSPSLQIGIQGNRRKWHNFQLLETRLC